MRLMVAVLLLLLSCSRANKVTQEQDNEAPLSNKTLLATGSAKQFIDLVSVVALAVTPERYDGQMVRTQGYLMYTDEPEEGGDLEPSQEAAEMGLAQGVWVSAGNCLEGEPANVSKKAVEQLLRAQAVSGFVMIEGIFRAHGLGPRGKKPALCNITWAGGLADARQPPRRGQQKQPEK